MTDFVIVIATIAGLAAPVPSADAASVPLNAPTMGFRTYADEASCEWAAAALVAPAGTRLVCLPMDRHSGELPSAY